MYVRKFAVVDSQRLRTGASRREGMLSAGTRAVMYVLKYEVADPREAALPDRKRAYFPSSSLKF